MADGVIGKIPLSQILAAIPNAEEADELADLRARVRTLERENKKLRAALGDVNHAATLIGIALREVDR